MLWFGAAGEDKVCGARSRSVKCIALLGSKRPRQSAMDLGGIRRLYLPLRPKGRLSPGRKTQGQGYRPSAGLRPLIVSRVKCGGGPCRGHSVLPCKKIRYAFNAPLLRNCRMFDISLPETRSGCDRALLNSFRPGSPSRPPSTGDGRLRHPPHHTGHGPFRTRPPFSIKSYFKKFTNPVITKVLTRLINRLPTSGTIKNASGD